MTDLCADLLGPDVNLYWDQAVYKKPEKPRRVPWHQDNGYTYIEPQQYLTIWLALTDATEDNGCPVVAPGVHRMGTLAHTYVEPLGLRVLQRPAARGQRAGRGGRRGRVLVAHAAPDRAEPHRRGAQGVHPPVRARGSRDARRRPVGRVARSATAVRRPRSAVRGATRRGARMTVHPLEPLTADEIARAVEILRAKEDRVEESMLIARVVLDEPTKDELRSEPCRTSRRDHRRARTGCGPARGGRVAHRRGRGELRRARRRAARDAVRGVASTPSSA